MKNDLNALGWTQYFTGQLTPDEFATLIPVRVAEVRRRSLVILDASMNRSERALTGEFVASDFAVGDFALADADRIIRQLERKSLISRKAAGVEAKPQLIAANVDTLLITTSCNHDFNEARIERYLALAIEADVHPVIVVTKADKPEDMPAEVYKERASAIYDGADVLVINAKDAEDFARLETYCGRGQTIALVGSSGVGKSTIARGLTGLDIEIGDIREDDAKGRHTTTSRSMYQMSSGGWLIDTPGMRELALHDAAEGIATLFEDITELATQCKFTDCAHESEPGCAVKAALENGTLDPSRLERWRKLRAEDAHNSETIAESRARGRKFSKFVKTVKKAKNAKRGG